MPKGIRLKRAIQALKAAPNIAIIWTKLLGGYNMNMTDIIERVMFVKGPARAVLPKVSLLIGPEIITAPGEIIFKGETIERRVISAPNMVNRNSAHNP